jgi:SAM-dependent methyltransferase
MASDSFGALARYYDPIMHNVDYDRWYLITSALTGLLQRPFVHLDIACGTGTLLRRLLDDRWNSFGVDLSISMLKAGKTKQDRWPVTVGDLRALPFHGSFDYVTCLFDSVNFLLTPPDLAAGIRSMADCLAPGGIVYFDIVTERMVIEHFAGQRWTERNGKFSTRWECDYDRTSQTVETRIQVNHGEVHTLHERVYELGQLEGALQAAGIELLGAFDAETWRKPRRKTVRIDIVGVKGAAKMLRREMRTIERHTQALLK